MASAVRNVVIAKPDPDAIRVENVGDGYFVLCQWDELSQSEQRVVVSADEDRAMLEAILSQKH